MIGLDYISLLFYIVGLFAIGGVFSRIGDSTQMFAADRQSPWWVSCLSCFMTIFSAGTFVVWGGIAYRSGMVAISILVCLGISSILVGILFAGPWRKSGVTTPAEFVNLRFGNSALQFLTWFNAVMSALAMSVGLYALSVVVAALINLPPNHILADPATGKLSIMWATIICGAITVIYTATGGLWAVLMTDVVQCIVLSLTVIIVVPLCIIKLGGMNNFISNAPEKFFSPANSEFTYKFFILWIAVNTFRFGGLWSLVQRYICVPSPKDAKKVAIFTGVLFIICPFLWMFPAMAYRVMNPDANPEQAYILACQTVLPAGMLGMVLATMFSATASMISGELNVYAGVFTRDIYRVFIRPASSEKHLVFVGRASTIIYGILIIGLALLIPFLGGAEQVVLTFMTLLSGPLVCPIVWGLFSKKINKHSVWATVLIAVIVGGIMKFAIATGAMFGDESEITKYVKEHIRFMEALVGLASPLVVLTIMQLRASGVDAGAVRVEQAGVAHAADKSEVSASTLPAKIVACTTAFLGILMSVVAIMSQGQKIVLVIFAAVLLLISAVITFFIYKSKK